MTDHEPRCDHRQKEKIITGLGTWGIFGFPDLIVGDPSEIPACSLLKNTPGCSNRCVNPQLTQNECPIPYQNDGDEIQVART